MYRDLERIITDQFITAIEKVFQTFPQFVAYFKVAPDKAFARYSEWISTTKVDYGAYKKRKLALTVKRVSQIVKKKEYLSKYNTNKS